MLGVSEENLLSGKLYSANELFELGIVDIVVEDGKGEDAVYEYLKKQKRSINTYKSVRKAKRCYNAVTFDELAAIATIWVDANMKLGKKELRMMERLVKRQSAKINL